MAQNHVIICSDLHLCHDNYYGPTGEVRLEEFIHHIKDYHQKAFVDHLFMLGDYSLDFWAWQIQGCYINEGKSNTDQFVKEYAARLPMPYLMLAGNHEQYGEEKWKELTGSSRRFAQVVGGWLFIGCDNFAGDLDPTEHSDGTYTPTDLAFIKEQMELYPHLPVILMAHWFELTKEPPAFFEFLQKEKRITLLFCGHDHLNKITDLSEYGANLCIYHDGNYSYTRSPQEQLWGFCDLILSEEGVEVSYIEPATALPEDPALRHEERIQNRQFFKIRK